MLSRCLFINPTPAQKQIYQLAYEAHTFLLNALEPGRTLDDVYKKTRDFIISKDASLKDRIHTNFGYGIGLAHREDGCLIIEGNQTQIQEGMTLHVRITFKD